MLLNSTRFFHKLLVIIVLTAMIQATTTTILRGQAFDCANAVQICNGIWPEPSATASVGANDIPSSTSKGCLVSGENGSNWYWAKITTTGVMAFSVQGITAAGAVADIDGAVYGPFASVSAGCTAINGAGGSAPLRCSYAANLGIELRTGIAQTSEGLAGDGVVGSVNVTAGQYYIILVDNFAAGTPNGAVSVSWNFTSGNTAGYECPAIPTTNLCANPVTPKQNDGNIGNPTRTLPGTAFQTCQPYTAVPFKSGDPAFTQAYTVTASAYGTLGATQQVSIRGTDGADADVSPDCISSVLASRTYTLVPVGNCAGTPIAATRNLNGLSSTFNPEWEGLTPNTNYVLSITTTMPAIVSGEICNYRQSCLDFYHWIPPLTPGCVAGTTLWLKADAGASPAAGGTLTSWTNEAGGISMNVNNAPQVALNTINFNPSVQFNGTTNYLNGSGNILNSEAFGVFNNTNADGTVIAYTTGTPDGSAVYFLRDQSANLISGAQRAVTSTTQSDYAFTAPLPSGFSLVHTGLADDAVRVNGTSQTSTAYDWVASHTKTPIIGRRYSPSTNSYDSYLSGHLAEVIVFGNQLTLTQREQVESYLAVKYGITLSHNYLNPRGNVVYNIATHANNITGIGRDSCETLNQKQSKSINSNALVTMGLTTIMTSNALNTNTFADTLYSIFGDDNAALTWQLTESPSGQKRLAREWKLTETGNVATVKVQIPDDSSPLSTKLPAEVAATVYLLVDSDSDFSTGATQIPMTLVGTNWETTYNFPTGTRYFTVSTIVFEDCANNIDDDGDGLVDCNDSDCKPIVPRLVGRN